MKLQIISLVIFSYVANAFAVNLKDVQETIEQLAETIERMQIKRTTPAVAPFIWAKLKGMYESDVKQYFHGGPEMSSMRYEMSIFDNNMFATAWITSCLLEAYKYGKAPKPTEEQLMISIEAIMDRHNDKNLNYTNSIMTFWPQMYVDEVKAWQSTPINLLALFNATDLINWDQVYPELDELGLHNISVIIKNLLASKNGYRHAFQIPPDFDDTSVNLGFGSLLKEMIIDFPQANALWQSRNSNLSSIFTAIKHYAYRPMSSDRRINTIDTRTYFYIRKFLELSKNQSRDVALVSTWVQDLVDVRKEYYQGVDIPGNVNNVDITVAANALNGITNSILSGLVTAEVLEDPDMQQIYLNTTTMIAYEINTNFSGRPELALTYYPSVMEFYWFVGRTYTQLRRRDKIDRLPHQAMKEAMDMMGSALRNYVTNKIVTTATPLGTDMVYYDDFLGNGDTDSTGKPIKYGEDRLFTTAMAVNALITTWTVYDDQTGKLHWETDTPAIVKTTAAHCVNFLTKYVLSGVYKPWNAFFSGSVKGFGTFWGEYPSNRYEFFNWTKVPDDHKYYGPTIRGIEGVPSEDWYETEAKKFKTPFDFHGFNQQGFYFPFWNSEPYTYTTSWSEYPHNRYEFFNWTKVPDDHKYHGPTIRGVEGVPSEDWYQTEAKKIHTPFDFHGFNQQDRYFPFWNSEPYTYTTSGRQYPHNRYEFFNWTKVPDNHRYQGPTIRGIEGVPSEDWYQTEAKKIKTPFDFHGFNQQDRYFPFWNSEPYTYTVTMLALSTITNTE